MSFRKVDLSSQIRSIVGEKQAVVDAGGDISGTAGLHLYLTTEDGQVKVVDVPIQLQGSEPGGGYIEAWGPCPEDLRSAAYHDPVVPGTPYPGDPSLVWKKDEGYVPGTAIEPGKLGALAGVYSALDTLAASLAK